MPITPSPADVLIVVDVQYDFLPGGALAVPDGFAVIAPINALARRFRHVVLTQDWHPPGHASFASSHPGKAPFETDAAPLRRADPVAGPLRPGHARRRDPREHRHSPCGARHPQGPQPGDRQLFRLRGGRPQDADRPRRLPEGARRRPRLLSPGLRPISASAGPPSTPAGPGSRPMSSRTRAAPSTRRARSPGRGPTWTPPASGASRRRRSREKPGDDGYGGSYTATPCRS